MKTRKWIPVYSLVMLSVFLSWTPAGRTGVQNHPAPSQSGTGARPPAGIPTVASPTRTEQITAPIPTTPPKASLISVGTPDIDGVATVTGKAGAVAPSASVAIINLSAHNLITTTANLNGGFSAALYAPPGSALQVKYDPDGERIAQLWQHSLPVEPAGDYSVINPLPGTILYTGPAPAGSPNSQSFDSVGVFRGDGTQWAGWWLSGTVQVPSGGQGPGLPVQPGQAIALTAQLRVTSPALNCSGTPGYTPDLRVFLTYMFGPEGRALPTDMWFNAHLFTPTGLPIEHEAPPEERGIGGYGFTSPVCLSQHTLLQDTGTFTFTVPSDLPDGYFLLGGELGDGGIPLSGEVHQSEVWYHFGSKAALPPLRVGSPAPPHIPWILLSDYPTNGYRGLQSLGDAEKFVTVNRVVYPPHLAVVPRLDERSGEAISYRLEPGSYWISGTDRRAPRPPLIPFRFPSGWLSVEVLKPDGTSDILGPSPVQQSSMRTPTTPGGSPLDEGTGHLGDLYHLATMDEAFDYRFEQDGFHSIIISGQVEDVFGNVYEIQGTYEVVVARLLDLDPAQLPTTPYQAGDYFAPGLHLFPPVPAEVHIQLVQMPNSDPASAITSTISGQANRFGYFQPPPGTMIPLELPGEFRVDVTASYAAPDGTLWMGTMTWGNVIEGPGALIGAHGRRGMDYKSETIDDMPAWFTNANLPAEKIGIENYYPYFSGDVHWGDETPDRPAKGDSIHSIITVKDLTGANQDIYNLMRDHYPRARNGFRWPPLDTSLTGLNKRLAIGEAPLFISTQSGIDPAVDPTEVDLWGYWYGSSERPDVHVRELISEDNMGTAYWRFNDTYGYQIGESAEGDLPGDLKWEFGGAVFRVPAEDLNQYAIYSSLWVLLPHNDPVGARVTPPFQDATGASINGGPIMTLLGEEIDMLFLPKGVRPGDVLQLEDVVSFSGHVGPPLDSRVDLTITSPSGVVRSRTLRANKIGWVYDPTFDFHADEVGRWTVDVSVLHDRPYAGNGAIPQSHNTGTVLGTSGRYEFYVVHPLSPGLIIAAPQPGFLSWPGGHIEPVSIQGIAPPGTTAVHYTIHDKGVVMAQGSLAPGPGGWFSLSYDAVALNDDFPFLGLTAHEGLWEGLADEVAINLLAVGGEQPLASTITLIGEQVFVEGGQVSRIYVPVVLR